MVCFAGFLACLCLLVFYVWQVKYLTSGFYSVGAYEREISRLLDEKNELEVSFAQNSFLGLAQQKISELNFQKATSVKYIELPENYLARAK